MDIKCAYTELVEVEKLKPYERNRNNHPLEQIERLAKLISFHGLRHPIIVSKLSNQVIAGNGRLEALKIMGEKMIPVDYQDFADEDSEYAFSVSDNAIALWADLDLAGINADLPELGPFDLDLLGIKDFSLDVSELDPQITGDMIFDNELDEKNDYLVFYFDDKEKFKQACEKYGVEQQMVCLSREFNPKMVTSGKGRILPGEKLDV